MLGLALQAAPGEVLSCPELLEQRSCSGACMLFVITRKASLQTNSLSQDALVQASANLLNTLSQASKNPLQRVKTPDPANTATILSSKSIAQLQQQTAVVAMSQQETGTRSDGCSSSRLPLQPAVLQRRLKVLESRATANTAENKP